MPEEVSDCERTVTFMSLQARRILCDRLFFQKASQREDLLDPSKTNTSLIALLLDVARHFSLQITCVRSDHHDDSKLGPHSHARGYCADVWPLSTHRAEDYMDENSPEMRLFLIQLARETWLHQIGLAGSAWTPANVAAAGSTCFHDDGDDHIHVGSG